MPRGASAHSMRSVSFEYTLCRRDFHRPASFWIFKSKKWRVYFALCAIFFVVGMIWGNVKLNLDPDFETKWHAIGFCLWIALIALVMIPPGIVLVFLDFYYAIATKDGDRFKILIDSEGYTAEIELVLKKTKWQRLSLIEETKDAFLFVGPRGLRFGLLKRKLSRELVPRIREVLAATPVNKKTILGPNFGGVYCLQCKYDLRGSIPGGRTTCPECGASIPP